MNNNEEFVQQLASWTEDVIEHGRTPFRRVDSFPEIDTDSGPYKPHLVFWINRQSLMAGGVLLLRQGDLEPLLKEGRNCATALGLNFFVTWEAQQVRIWHIEKDAVTQSKSFPLNSPDQPETFKLLLHDLLDALKLLAVLKAIPPRELPVTYFNNLFQITLEQTQPSYTKSIRSSRSDAEGEMPLDSDQLASEINRLTLLQILALLWQQRLATTLLPDSLGETLRGELLQLPADLRNGLYSTTDSAILIPPEASIFFHHLILRLRQLAWADAEERRNLSFQRLIQSWFPLDASVHEADYVLLPPAPALAPGTALVLSPTPLLLAATALLRRIAERPPCSLKLGNIIELTAELNKGGSISAHLSDNRTILKTERQQLIMQLRHSWPSRRFKVTTGQPLWIWEALHLIGLCSSATELLIDLPASLTKVAPTHPLWEALCQQLQISEINCTTNRSVSVRLRKRDPETSSYRLQLLHDEYNLPYSSSPKILRNQLLLALHLPAETFALIGRAFSWPTQDNDSLQKRPGADLYRQSRLHQLLCRLTGMAVDDSTPGLPYPTSEFFDGLEQAQADKNTGVIEDIDTFLSELLNSPDLLKIQLPGRSRSATTGQPNQEQTDLLIEQAVHKLEVQGIPNFPEQYFYFIEQPQLQSYNLTPPISITNEILGQFDLIDGSGKTLICYGEELKTALLLCAATGKNNFELPESREDLEILVDHYRKDLEALLATLKDLCFSQIEKTQAARKLIELIWKRLGLPSLEFFTTP
jgi:hypothetical protein